ncbi:MAG: hypothetical protein M5T61_21870 [Acidimicrobiia bacterium]|nr:hypothetical protein [Acidimicrobiia bacterium]
MVVRHRDERLELVPEPNPVGERPRVMPEVERPVGRSPVSMRGRPTLAGGAPGAIAATAGLAAAFAAGSRGRVSRNRYATPARLRIKTRREPVVAESVENAARERKVHAAHKIAVIVHQSVERAIREPDLTGRRIEGFVAARLERLA